MTTFTKRLASIAATAAGIFLLASCGNGNAPSELRCEYQEGYDILIDTQSPRLSWINNCQQTAYQILVATDKALLKEGETDLWDSGRTEGSESQLVKYSRNLMPSKEPRQSRFRLLCSVPDRLHGKAKTSGQPEDSS